MAAAAGRATGAGSRHALIAASRLAPHTAATLRALGDLNPTTLAIMHGSSCVGDGCRVLDDAAVAYEKLIALS